MSDTPRTDAAQYKQTDSNPPEPLGMVDVDFARQLERELASVTKGSLELEEERDELDRELQDADRQIRTLIEERDRARIQADHKWRLREEFETLLGTSDVAIGVERVKEAQRGAARYEYLRTLNKRQFAALVDECLFEDLNFDAEVDRRRSTP